MADKTLEKQLKEKEELVAALTERLELAAEQLDRMQRSGANRGSRGGGGSLPSELVEKHESLVDDLQAAVQQWNEMQAGLALGNLERQMADLQEMLSSGLGGGLPLRNASTAAGGRAGENEAGSEQDEDSAERGNGEDKWAELKSYLLDGNDPQNDRSAESKGRPEGLEKSAASTVDASAAPQSGAPSESVAAPPRISDDEQDPAVLRSAVEARDDYIAFLIRKLGYANANSRLPANWQEWEGEPQEICREIEELRAQLNETLRLSELEHSLERARLAREESRVKQLEETVRKSMRQLGLDPEVDCGEIVDLEPERDTAKGSRWLRMLGICGDDEDDFDE